MNSQRIRFAILLPLLALAVWYFLVPAQIGFTWLRLHQLARQSTDGSANLPNVVIPGGSILSFAVMSVGMRQGNIVTALNIPGLLGEVLISLPTTWPELWHPFDLPEKSWRSLCLPFFCLPAWWFVGCGLESLLGWLRLRWWTLLIGTLLFTICLVLLLGLTFGQSPQERAEDTYILLAFAFWTLAFAVFPAAWIHRGFTQRRQRAETIKVSL